MPEKRAVPLSRFALQRPGDKFFSLRQIKSFHTSTPDNRNRHPPCWMAALHEAQSTDGMPAHRPARLRHVAAGRTPAGPLTLKGTAMPAEESTPWSSVQHEEMAAVRAYRSSIREPPEQHLVGLALSGGGIRSATFSLGVLEALKSTGLLRKIDYLSTVSGGGYIGAWLSANCIRAARRREALREFQSRPALADGPRAAPIHDKEFIRAARDWLSQEADWTQSIGHLRRYSNYLSPKLGFFSADTWSMATTWIRNTLLIQFSVVLGLAAILLMPRLLVALFQAWPEMGNWRWASIVLFVWAAAGIAHNQLQLNGSSRLSRFDRLLRHGPGCLVASLACLGLAWATSHAMVFEPFEDQKPNWAVIAVAPLVVLAGFFLLPALALMTASVRRRLARRPALDGRLPGSADPGHPGPLNYSQGGVQLAVVLPMLITGFLFAAILRGQAGRPLGQLDTFGMLFLNAWRWWPFPLCVTFASVWLFSFCSIREPRRWTGMIAALLAPVPAVVALHALLCVLMLLMHRWPGNTDHGIWQAFVWAPALVLYAFSLSVVTMIGMMGRDSTEAVREWWSRLGAWLIIYGMAWMIVAISAAYGPNVAGLVPSIENWSGSVVAGWLATTASSLMAGQSRRTGAPEGRGHGNSAARKALALLAGVGPYVFIAGMMIGIASAIKVILVSIEGPKLLSGQPPPTEHWPMMSYPGLPVTLAVTLFTLAGLLMLAARVDINEFSLNAFYRSRLTRCYLGAARFLAGERQPQRFTQFDDDDDLRMAELAGEHGASAAGPLHIVNCALNLGGSSDLSLHTRHSASFTLSPYRAGSSDPVYDRNQACPQRELGYRPIAMYAGDKDQPTLAQAISVSGAAASPNMGYHTSPAVAFLLTVFNMRLGWWFPNPSLAGAQPPSWFSLRYLVKELFGNADQRSKHLMISDGGHFENLAAYELIRRKCRVIIVSDAECDPELGFGGLGTLIRMAEVDFGAVITVNLDAIRPRADTGWSTERYAVGTIDYGPSHPQGVLIYLKAAMSGAENPAILQYKASHAAFPHESTGNQFYGEDQFESYRHLGREAAESAFGSLNCTLDMADVAGELLSRSSLAQVARSLQESG
jgi:hypothetical protein